MNDSYFADHVTEYAELLIMSLNIGKEYPINMLSVEIVMNKFINNLLSFLYFPTVQ